MTNPIKCEVGGVDLSQYLKRLDASPAGPGQVATGTLYLTKQAGGLTILNKAVVKVWQTFDAAGNGVAARGRYFGGFVDIRNEGNAGTTEIWDLPCVSFQVALGAVVRDASPAKAFNVPASDFDTMIAYVVQTVQENGNGTVNLAIDATSQVANLYTGTIPTWTAPPGKNLEYYIKEVCNRAKALDTALRPAYFIDTGRTFGVGDTFGGPVLHIYDGALTPSPVYAFSDTPSGAEKSIYGEVTRELQSQSMVQRKQAVYGDNFVATYQNATSAGTYPNPLINHLIATNKGYWMAEAVDDTQSTTLAQAEAALALQVQPVEYPRETVILPEIYDIVLPGEVVTVEHSLLIPTPTNYRVAQASFDFSDPTQVVQSLTLGTRRRELLDTQEEASGAQPREGDIVGPEAPTSLAHGTDLWVEGTARWSVPLTFVASVSADVDHYDVHYIIGGQVYPAFSIGLATAYTLDVPASTLWVTYVRGVDTHGNEGSPSSTVSATTAAAPTPAAPTSFAVAASGITRRGTAWRKLSRTASTYTPIGHYDIEWWLTDDSTNKAMFSTPDDAVTTLATETAPDESFTYRIRTVSTGGLIGAWSSTIASTVVSNPWYDGDGGSVDMDSNAPGVTFAMWPDSGVAVTGSAAVGDRTSSTTNVLNGKASMKLNLATGPSTIYSTSVPVAVRTGDILSLKLARIADGARGVAKAILQWLDKAGSQVGADVTLWSATPTTAWVTNEPTQQTAPATATAFRLKLGFETSGLWTATVLYWAAPIWTLVKSANDLGAGTVTNTKLGTLTDVTKFALDIETNPWSWKKADGSGIGSVTWDAGRSAIQYGSNTKTYWNGEFTHEGSFGVPYSAKSANYTLTTNDYTITVDCTGGIRTMTLPAASGATGRVYVIKKIDSSGNKVTVDGNASETIDGATTKDITAQYQAITIQCDGTGWHIIGAFP